MRTFWLVLPALVVMSVFFALAIIVGTMGFSPSIPQCAEDAVVVGSGSFDNGRWSEYRCGPSVDDYSEAN
jgi:hypothetical protein